jgi:hypothetical protein
MERRGRKPLPPPTPPTKPSAEADAATQAAYQQELIRYDNVKARRAYYQLNKAKYAEARRALKQEALRAIAVATAQVQPLPSPEPLPPPEPEIAYSLTRKELRALIEEVIMTLKSSSLIT